MKSAILFFVVLIFLQVAYASDSAPGGIPWGHIGIQAFNFSLLFGLIFWKAGKPVKEMFSKRLIDYNEEFERAEKEMKTALETKNTWLNKLSNLKTTAAESVATAKSESQAQKSQLISETEEKAKQMKIAADKSIELTVEKSKSQLQKELLNDSLNAARENLATKVDQPLNKNLNQQFFDKMKAVQ